MRVIIGKLSGIEGVNYFVKFELGMIWVYLVRDVVRDSASLRIVINKIFLFVGINLVDRIEGEWCRVLENELWEVLREYYRKFWDGGLWEVFFVLVVYMVIS